MTPPNPFHPRHVSQSHSPRAPSSLVLRGWGPRSRNRGEETAPASVVKSGLAGHLMAHLVASTMLAHRRPLSELALPGENQMRAKIRILSIPVVVCLQLALGVVSMPIAHASGTVTVTKHADLGFTT